MYVQLVILVIAIIAAVALQPKPPGRKPSSLEEIDIPTADEGRPIPVVYGTVVTKSPNVVWYGDLGYQPVKQKGGK